MTEKEQTTLLAEKVMGWVTPKEFYSRVIAGGWDPFHSIADAWMLVDRLRDKRYRVKVLAHTELNHYDAAFFGPGVIVDVLAWKFATTAPEAICLAALRTLEVSQ